MAAKPRFLITTTATDTVLAARGPLMRAMQARGWEAHVAIPASPFVQQLQDAGFHAHALELDRGSMNPLKERKTIQAYKDLLEKVQPTLSHHFAAKSIMYGSQPNSGIHIGTVTGLGFSFGESGNPLKRAVARRASIALYRKAIPNIAHLIFQNPLDQQLLQRYVDIPAPKTSVIYGCGVDTDHFHPDNVSQSNEKVRFVLLTRMLLDKGLREFSEAAKIVHQKLPNRCEFHLVGPMDNENPNRATKEQIRKWESECGITYVPPVPSALDAYRDAHVGVLPSYYAEGLPRVLTEASSMGLPIITTTQRGCIAAIRDGVTGIVVQPRSIQDLADAMYALASDSGLRKRMGDAGRLLAETEFSTSVVQRRILDVYHSTLIAAGQSGIGSELPSFAVIDDVRSSIDAAR